MESDLESHFTNLSALHENLSKAALEFQSPFLKSLMRLITSSPASPNDSDGISVPKRIWHVYLGIYTPFHTISFSDLMWQFGFFIGIIGIQTINSIVGFFLLWILASQTIPLAPAKATPPDWLQLIPLIAAWMLSLPAMIDRWRVLASDRRYNVLVRILLVLGLISVAAIIIFYFPIQYGFGHPPTLGELLIRYQVNIALTLVAIALLMPTITILYGNIIDAVIWIVWTLVAGAKAVLAFHDPLPAQHVHRLAFVHTIVWNGQNLHLADISDSELAALKKLAEANREGTDKRLVPIAIVMGILQFFGWDWFLRWGLNSLWEAVVQFLKSGLTNATTGSFLSSVVVALIIGTVFGIAFSFTSAFVSLLSNLAAQSIIVEACELIQYSQEKVRELQKPPARRKGFWTRLGELLDGGAGSRD